MIASALAPLSPLEPDADVVAVTAGVVVVGVDVTCGTPGESGPPGPWASDAGAAPSAQPMRIAANAPDAARNERRSSN